MPMSAHQGKMTFCSAWKPLDTSSTRWWQSYLALSLVVLLPILPPSVKSIAVGLSAMHPLTSMSILQIWQMASNIYEDDFQQGPKA